MISFLVPSAYAASPWTGSCIGYDTVPTIQGINCLIEIIFKPIPSLIALISIGMIIYAGIKLLMAGADPKATAAAWKTLTYAVVGLIMLVVSWVILVIIQRYTGADILNFGIPTF